MPFAGDPILASDVNTRIAITSLTADSVATVGTTESGALHSVAGTLISGTTYRIRWIGNVSASVAGDCYFIRIRQDTATGTQIGQAQNYCDTTSNVGFTTLVEAEYTAVSTGAKTFVVTVTRNDGTGVGNIRAVVGRPALLSIEKINSV